MVHERQSQDLSISSLDAARPTWWDVLRAIREARGLTQEVWAGLLGYSRSTVRRWEAGVTAPDDAAEKAITDHCIDRGVFHAYERGPLAGLSLSREFLHEILADARLDISGAHGRSASSATLVSELPSPRRNNLPQSMTSFIGRRREMAAVHRLLHETRLLTLMGPGGVGKTRLAIEAARLLVDDYPDGIWLVELAPLTDVALVPQRFATALGFQEQPGRPLASALLEHLASRRLLLLIDNCEHRGDAGRTQS
jgi:transcriptional regulator with XRE-family HTH domain